MYICQAIISSRLINHWILTIYCVVLLTVSQKQSRIIYTLPFIYIIYIIELLRSKGLNMMYAMLRGSMPKAVLEKSECYHVGLHLNLGGASISLEHEKRPGNWFR